MDNNESLRLMFEHARLERECGKAWIKMCAYGAVVFAFNVWLAGGAFDLVREIDYWPEPAAYLRLVIVWAPIILALSIAYYPLYGFYKKYQKLSTELAEFENLVLSPEVSEDEDEPA